MKCYSCGKQKNELSLRKSSIIPGVNLMLCQSCIDSKFEPRWVIILAARQNGASSVRDFIIKRRYIGQEILGNEIVS